MIVNFGCGPDAPDGYVNVDGSLTVLFARLPLPAAIYGQSHAPAKRWRAQTVLLATPQLSPGCGWLLIMYGHLK